MTAPEASLVWILVDGLPRHASEFAEFAPRDRPTAKCPQCGRRMILKLGRVRRHHAAHDTRSDCAATNPETALHLDCKLALAAALAAAVSTGDSLRIEERCHGGGAARDDECGRRRITWLERWDEARLEHRVGVARRPDIALFRDGRPIGAIEVVATNAVSSEKARALRDLELPWIEVTASEALVNRDAWTPRTPLPAERTSMHDAWRCAEHGPLHAAAVAADAEQRAAEREAARHATALRAARVVDLYHDGGARERFIYRVLERLVDGRPAALRLQRGTAEVLDVPYVDEPRVDRRAAWDLVRDALRRDVERLARSTASFSDSPMRWAREEIAEAIVDEAIADRVGHDPTPLATRYPRRWFYHAAEKRWFLPPDMRAVSWDRQAPDAFAAHPAWARARSAVRERPAPEGSWKTPVFSSRPVAGMFSGSIVAAITAPDRGLSFVELVSASAQRRGIVVVETDPSATAIDAAIAALAERLAADGVEALWISHPRDWRPSLAGLTWAPGGRDWHGNGGIVIDDVGVFRANDFARAFARGDRRLGAPAVREHLRGRVERLASSLLERGVGRR